MPEPVVVRSLDHLGALAAHHVLGWGLNEGGRHRHPAVHPAENIADAWRLVEAMAEKGFHCVIKTPFAPGDHCHAGFTPHGVSGWNGRPDHRSGPAPAVPAAICLAALAAVGHTVRLELEP